MTARLSLLVEIPPYDDPVAAIAGLAGRSIEVVAGTADPRLARWPGVIAVEPGPGFLSRALAAATAPAVAIADSGAVVDPAQLGPVLAAAGGDDGTAVIYTDERVAGVEVRKPAWSPTFFRHFNYLGRLTVVPRDLAVDAGGFPDGTPDEALHGLVLRLAAAGVKIRGVPVMAYERLRPEMPHLVPFGVGPGPEATVSVLMPTAGTRALDGRSPSLYAARALDSVRRAVAGMDVELVVVAGPEADEAAIAELVDDGGDLVRVLRDPRPFDFSRRTNLAAESSRSQVLVWLNDDVHHLKGDGWLAALVELALEDGIGAVGAKLLYPDSTVQAVGVRFHNGLPGHIGVGAGPEEPGPLRAFIAPREYAALTGAVLATRADVFDEVGGMSPTLPVNFGDTDYCLKVRARGYRVVLTPAATLRHYESASRHPVVHPRDTETLLDRWPGVVDPYWPWPAEADMRPLPPHARRA